MNWVIPDFPFILLKSFIAYWKCVRGFIIVLFSRSSPVISDHFRIAGLLLKEPRTAPEKPTIIVRIMIDLIRTLFGDRN